MSDEEHPTDVEELEASGLFDRDWYLDQHPDVRLSGLDPLGHFHAYGCHEGRSPNRHFDAAWYLEHNPDVGDVGMDPLLHYARHGEHENRRPTWYFDPAWYRAVYDLPSDVSPLAHFLEHRTTGRFAPCPEFYSVPHMSPYRDDPAAGLDPFAHYLDDMLRAGRDPLPDLDVVNESGLIDPNYYLINGSDVHEADIDPAIHFCRYGWREMRKPNIYFDTQWYRDTNPVVSRLKLDPLVHYILEGEMTGRRPIPYFDPLWYRATYGIEPGKNALAHFLTHRRSQAFSPNPMFDVAWYVKQHAEELGTNRDPFAHFLQAGTFRDLDPSADFDAAAYRRRHIGRPSRQFRHLMHPDKDNPLVHHLRTTYR